MGCDNVQDQKSKGKMSRSKHGSLKMREDQVPRRSQHPLLIGNTMTIGSLVSNIAEIRIFDM